jgi:hypothetical protein
VCASQEIDNCGPLDDPCAIDVNQSLDTKKATCEQDILTAVCSNVFSDSFCLGTVSRVRLRQLLRFGNFDGQWLNQYLIEVQSIFNSVTVIEKAYNYVKNPIMHNSNLWTNRLNKQRWLSYWKVLGNYGNMTISHCYCVEFGMKQYYFWWEGICP